MITDTRTGNRGLVIAAIGAVACVIGVVIGGLSDFFPAYLVGAMFWIEIAFGALALTLLHLLTGGGWGDLARRPFYAAASTMPLAALIFLPVLAGVRALYPWANSALVAHDEVLRHKTPYLNLAFFIGRTGFYFLLWSGLALFLFARARRRGSKGPSRSMRTIAGPGLLALGLTMTFASIDWIMSLDAHWFSTMVGLLLIVGSLLSAMAFTIVIVTSEWKEGEHHVQALHDLGNLLLVFTMLWAYLSFSQYLIIYSGNMTEDISFFVYRTERGWQTIALLIILFHFCVPFCVLLSRRSKRNPKTLRVIAIGVLLMRLVELFWFVEPAFRGHEMHIGILDFATPLLVGGVWFFWFTRRVKILDAGRGSPGATPAAVVRRR
jgi:hypothetical protein